MNIRTGFEQMGQAQMLAEQGNRQIAAALLAGAGRLARRLTARFGKSTRDVPGEHQLP